MSHPAGAPGAQGQCAEKAAQQTESGLCCPWDEHPWAAVTEGCKLGGLDTRNVLAHSSGGESVGWSRCAAMRASLGWELEQLRRPEGGLRVGLARP